MGEQPIFTTKAHVFQIDPATKKKWLPASAQAINVSFYYDSTRNTYRIISVEGSKAVINSTITPNMTFTKTSVKFGQWSDSRANTVYGLGFNTEADLTKFVEKFKEVKELTRQASPSPKPTNQTNGSSPTPDNSSPLPDTTTTAPYPHSPVNSPKPTPIKTHDTVDSRLSTNATNVTNNQLVEQLKYENDRLKIALAQSSTNAKKWEIELQTLKNNNARLTTALQESTANVEEWKKQLAIYKEESARMKKKVLDSEKSGSAGSELLQRQLADTRDKMADLETSNSQKQMEINTLNAKIDDYKASENERQQLTDKIQSLEHDKEALVQQTQTLKDQLDTAQNSHGRHRQELRQLQGDIGSKVADLYGLSDKLAELLQR